MQEPSFRLALDSTGLKVLIALAGQPSEAPMGWQSEPRSRPPDPRRKLSRER
jgi:hypothetical protein